MASKKGKVPTKVLTRRKKAAKKPSTALVKVPRAKLPKAPKAPAEKKKTTAVIELPTEQLSKDREATLKALQAVEKEQVLLKTFDENILSLANYALVGRRLTKVVHWAVGRRLNMMRAAGTFGDVVKDACKPLDYKRSALWEMCWFHEFYPSVTHVAKLEDANMGWDAIQWLIKVNDERVRNNIVETIIREKIRRSDVVHYVRGKAKEWRAVQPGQEKKSREKVRKQKADDELQFDIARPKGYFARLEQLLAQSWKPIQAHLLQLGAMKVLMKEEKETPDSEYDDSILKLAECRRQVRIWNDNLAVIVRLADGVSEPQ